MLKKRASILIAHGLALRDGKGKKGAKKTEDNGGMAHGVIRGRIK